MPRKHADAPATTWQDIAECVPAWEAEQGVRVSATIHWQQNLSQGAYVEVVLWEAITLDARSEVVRVRHMFPTKKASGQAGAVMYAIFDAFREYEANPWLWSRQKRASVTDNP